MLHTHQKDEANFVGMFAILNRSNASQYTNITPADAENMMKKQEAMLLDVRTKDELNEGTIAGFKLVDLLHFRFKYELAKLDKNVAYIVYCRSGTRSAKACKIMHRMGFSSLYNLKGGIIG